MTDAAFNRYLATWVRQRVPASLPDDPHVELQDGKIAIVGLDYRLDEQDRMTAFVGNPWRSVEIITLGLEEARAELGRRSFER